MEGAGSGIAASTYPNRDEDMLGAETQYSPVICFFSSTALILGALGLTDHLIRSDSTISFVVITSLSVLLICMRSPIDTDARKLSAKEICVFKKISRILTIAAYLLCIGLLINQSARSAIPIGMGLNLTALLQLPCLIGSALNRNKRN